MRILIVENDLSVRSWLMAKMTAWGHDPVAASDGDEAIEVIKVGTIDLMFADWDLAIGDSPKLIKRIRHLDVKITPYIILLTPAHEVSELITGIETGIDDLLIKPIQSIALQARVMAASRIIQLERELTQQNDSLELANAQMKNDLIVASKIQSSFLPHVLPAPPEVEFKWGLLPCQELAGDALNVIKLDDRHIGIYLLDVSGHGVTAALMAMTLIHLLSADKPNSALFEKTDDPNREYRILEPKEVTTRLNNRFPLDDINGQYFTCVYGILNLDSLELCYASAGHQGPIRIPREGPSQSFPSTGMPIGFFPDSPYDQELIQLQPGDRVYFFSDGIPESMNKYEEQFGLERMTRTLKQYRGGSYNLSDSIDNLAVAALKWKGMEPLSDDVSVIGLETK